MFVVKFRLHQVHFVKTASNDFGCICKQIWKKQFRMKAYITISRTKLYCPKLCIKLIITMKFFLHSLCHLSELLSLVTCEQRADHFTPMMWFDFIRWRFHLIRRRFHYSNCIRYNQNNVTQNCISPETHNWYMYRAWEIKIQNLWLTQMASQGGVWGQKIFACLCFLWNNLWSVSRYIMGPFSGWWRLEGRTNPVSNPPIWKCRSGIGDRRFPFSWICFQITHLTQILLFCSLDICLQKMWQAW